jgi:hypothetical protein
MSIRPVGVALGLASGRIFLIIDGTGDPTGGFEIRSVLKDGLDINWVGLYAENLDLRLL